jgi:hypothetical protein
MEKPTEIRKNRLPRTLTDPVLSAVKAQLVAHGMTIQMLADEIGYVKGTVKNVLQGRNNPGVRAKIEEFFGRPFWTNPSEWERKN